MCSYIIKTVNLTKEFKSKPVIKNLNFTLKKGEICAIIGKNGAGKSTFFKMLSSQVLPTEGLIQLDNQEDKNLDLSRKKFSFLIEAPAFFDNFTAKQNLEYYRIQRGIDNKKLIDELIRMVKLEEHTKVTFSNYSMGMKQRLGIALCLLSNPDCLVLDEPTNGLDAEGIRELRQLLINLNKEKNTTILISSHVLSELQNIATRYVFLDKGKIIEDINANDFEKKSSQHLKIKVNDTSLAVDLLKQFERNLQCEILEDNWIIVKNNITDGSNINTFLTKNNITVYEIKVEHHNLEGYFFNLLGGDLT
ncbi:ATP-binding cassette domain-containing protein [Bacillus thuringiensis]|uniref:ATP-binding cassette domain-containing protein n=1 Tax=Bacillus thuringiensis TaxID=1428 RepID=UPI00124C7E2F|nr:ATP-binding cassette domain-containing protein [Bacillus thuringiensis]KAB2364264.1 ATP-binding cassette domain-containing protein [Bacillus thuringiensis]